jgi:hypothetical protein
METIWKQETPAVQLPLFLWTIHDGSFQLVIVMYTKETNRKYVLLDPMCGDWQQMDINYWV